MPNPVPGMDPYLEANWRDVHSSLVIGARDALNMTLPDDLIARVEERVAIETDEELRRLVVPAVRAFKASCPATGAAEAPAAANAAATVARPVLLRAQVEPLTERYVTVVDANAESLVSVIEFLSPTNKRRGEGMRDYRGKRGQLVDGRVSVVEVDLVRQGDWAGLLMTYVAHPAHHTAYRVTAWRAGDAGQVLLYPISFRQRLPSVPVPLRPTDADAVLDLQALLDQAYRNGRYERTIDYARDPDPPLEPEDAAWANERLRAGGRR